jgi:4-hydroxy-3-methylbut-2-enyl diphosphate reductase
VQGTLGEAPEAITVVSSVEDVPKVVASDPDKVVALTQTTLSMDESREIISALRKRFPKLTIPTKDDVCYATQNRQDAVKHLVQLGIDHLLVVGSKNSSNSLRLCEVARALGVDAHLIDRASEVDPAWFKGKQVLGLTAGASAPEYLVEDVVSYLESLGAVTEELDIIHEHVSFALPTEMAEMFLDDKTKKRPPFKKAPSSPNSA